MILARFTKIPLIIALVLTSFFCGFVVPAEAALVVEPALIKLELSQNRSSGAFVIKNTGDKEERYRAKAVHFILTPEGALKEMTPDEYSLADWVKFNPKEFVLPPKSSRVVRFSVLPAGKVRSREYWGAIEFMPLKGAKVISQDDKGRSFNLEVLSVVLVPIYGYVDGTKYAGMIKGVSFQHEDEKQYIYCRFLNTGDGILRLDGDCQIMDFSGTVLEKADMKNVAVFTGSERIIKCAIKKPLSPGKYRARINLKSIDPHSSVGLSAELEFDV